MNTAQVAARVDTIRQVRSAQVTRSWPDRLVIVVRERTPALALPAPAAAGTTWSTRTAWCVQWVARRPADLPLYPTVAPRPRCAATRAWPRPPPSSANCPPSCGVRWSRSPRRNPDQVTLRLAGGVTVLWGGTGRAAVKARELAVLMRAHLRYYDVSAPGSVAAK